MQYSKIHKLRKSKIYRISCCNPYQTISNTNLSIESKWSNKYNVLLKEANEYWNKTQQEVGELKKVIGELNKEINDLKKINNKLEKDNDLFEQLLEEKLNCKRKKRQRSGLPTMKAIWSKTFKQREGEYTIQACQCCYKRKITIDDAERGPAKLMIGIANHRLLQMPNMIVYDNHVRTHCKCKK